MKMKIATILPILVGVLFLISLVIAGLFFFGGKVPNTTEPSYTSALLLWAYILLAIAVLSLIGFFFFSAVSDWKILINAGIALAFIGVIVLIGYLLASDAALPAFAEKGYGPATYKLSGMGLNSMYILFGISILSIIGSEIYRLFK